MDKLTRKANLAEWVAAHGVPAKEKSLFSQLKDPDTSFGEKVARRLEAVYLMGDGFLDRKIGSTVHAETMTDEIIELLALYQCADGRGRENLLSFARSTVKHASMRWVRATKNQA